jgi:hypothetical protein
VSHPTAFISYSWDDYQHREWVAKWATRLRHDGIDVKLDQWHVVPGDRLPEFMEREIRDNSFVLIVCTPRYKWKSNTRQGGVGYEGDIMTGEVMTLGNQNKFIPILARGTWGEAAPSWLSGKLYIDFSHSSNFEQEYRKLHLTVTGKLPGPPLLGPVPNFGDSGQDSSAGKVTFAKEETEILIEASERGELYLRTSDGQGTWVAVHQKNYLDIHDPAVQAVYREAFDSLCKKGYVRHEGGISWKLTGNGFLKARELAKAAQIEAAQKTNTPTIDNLPKASKLKEARVHFRSDAEAFELICTIVKRGAGTETYHLEVEGIGVKGKTPEPIEFGDRYGQFWVIFNGKVYGATLECTGHLHGHPVMFRLNTIINDPSFWALGAC